MELVPDKAVEAGDTTTARQHKRQREDGNGAMSSPPTKRIQQANKCTETLTNRKMEKNEDNLELGEREHEETSQGSKEVQLETQGNHRAAEDQPDQKDTTQTGQTAFTSPLDIKPMERGAAIKASTLSKSLSEDTCDQDASMTESLTEDRSMSESGSFSFDVSGTECESLSTSLCLPHDHLEGELPHLSGGLSPKSKSEDNLNMDRKYKAKKKRKNDKKNKMRLDKGDKEDTNVRPNYFIGIKISNPDIHKRIVKIQEDMITFDSSLARSLVDVATSHITLLVAHIDTEESLLTACSALSECKEALQEALTISPIQLTFEGVDHFSNRVVYAKIVEDGHYQDLLKLAEQVRKIFSEKGVCMPDTRPLLPHLTIAKLSKVSRAKGKHNLRKIEVACYRQHTSAYLGSQSVAGLQLLAMNKPKDGSRFYYCSKEVSLDTKDEESADHSECCFPRRPLMTRWEQKRGYCSTGVEEAHSTAPRHSPEPPPNWAFPTVAVTVFATVVALGIILTRLHNRT